MTKKAFAREWLFLLGGLVFGLFIQMPVLIMLAYSQQPKSPAVVLWFDMISELFGGRGLANALELWLVTMAAYLLFQLLRSVKWAIKTTKTS